MDETKTLRTTIMQTKDQMKTRHRHGWTWTQNRTKDSTHFRTFRQMNCVLIKISQMARLNLLQVDLCLVLNSCEVKRASKRKQLMPSVDRREEKLNLKYPV